MKKRILLTYATYGNGHRAVAQYIESYFKEQDPELEILAIDLLKYSTPLIGRLSQKITDFFLLKFPTGWSIIYNLFDSRISSAIASTASMSVFQNKYMRKVIKDFNPDIVYSEFNISAIIASKLENKPLYTTISYPTQTEYASNPKYAKGVNKFLKENNLPEVNSTLDLFNWAEKSFVPSIYELEPIDKEDVTFCGTWKDLDFQSIPNEDDKNNDSKKKDNVILVYMGNGTISANKMLKEIKDAFLGGEYEVYIASLSLEKQDYDNIHVNNRWDFSKLFKNAVLFINHGGQNSVIDGLVYALCQIACVRQNLYYSHNR